MVSRGGGEEGEDQEKGNVIGRGDREEREREQEGIGGGIS